MRYYGKNERWVGGLDEIVLSENEISVCNCDFDFEHVDCVWKQEIQFFKILPELSVKNKFIIVSSSFGNSQVCHAKSN